MMVHSNKKEREKMKALMVDYMSEVIDEGLKGFRYRIR